MKIPSRKSNEKVTNHIDSIFINLINFYQYILKFNNTLRVVISNSNSSKHVDKLVYKKNVL